MPRGTVVRFDGQVDHWRKPWVFRLHEIDEYLVDIIDKSYAGTRDPRICYHATPYEWGPPLCVGHATPCSW